MTRRENSFVYLIKDIDNDKVICYFENLHRASEFANDLIKFVNMDVEIITMVKVKTYNR